MFTTSMTPTTITTTVTTTTTINKKPKQLLEENIELEAAASYFVLS